MARGGGGDFLKQLIGFVRGLVCAYANAPEEGGPVSYSKVTDIKTNVFLSVLRFVAVIVESYKESLETLAL